MSFKKCLQNILRLFFFSVIIKNINGELKELVNKFMIRTQEWKTIISAQETVIANQSQMLATQSKMIEDLKEATLISNQTKILQEYIAKVDLLEASMSNSTGKFRPSSAVKYSIENIVLREMGKKTADMYMMRFYTLVLCISLHGFIIHAEQ